MNKRSSLGPGSSPLPSAGGAWWGLGKRHLRTAVNVGKYLLAAGLLVWVVRSNWAPPPTRAVAALAASTVGLAPAPAGCGPLAAAALALPDRTAPHGLGYVWQRHVVEGRPIAGWFLLAGFVLYSFAVLLTLLRWYVLVRALGLPLRLRDALRFGLIGTFFNAFLPGSVGGDIIKAAALARGQTRRTAAVATVIMDRVLGLWALVGLVAVLGGPFWLAGGVAGPAAAIIAFAVTATAASAAVWGLVGFLPDRRADRFAGRLAQLPLVGRTAAELWLSVWIYRRRPGSVAGVVALSWLGQAGFVVAFYCCARSLASPAMGPVPSLADHFLLVPVGLVMQAVVPTPGGAGGGEWAFAALYVLFGGAEANGVLASLVRRMFEWVMGLVGCGVYLWVPPPTATAPATSLEGRGEGAATGAQVLAG